MKSLLRVAFVGAAVCLTCRFAPAQTGRFENIVVHSEALVSNLLGDGHDRAVTVYLPAAYDQNPEARFPVVYMLHGYTGTNSTFIDYYGLKTIFDNVFAQGSVPPMIIVVPNAHNTYRGSWYTNSSVSGGWEDFISLELVAYVDQRYRTIAEASGRGITGHSMGGYGAFKLAMKHPDVYGAVYSMSAACISFEHVIMGTMFSELLNAVQGRNFYGLHWRSQAMVAAAVAFAPRPIKPPPGNLFAPPYMCEFPVDAAGSRIDSCWQRWCQHDLYSLIETETYRNNLLQITGIALDCGELDDLITSNRAFHEKLEVEGIPHLFDAYAGGDHTNKVPERVASYVLPFFADMLTTAVAVNDDHQIPGAVELSQNYPNPFNPGTKIEFALPHAGYISLKVYNVLGEEVATLLTGERAAGTFTVTWDASGMPSGVYC